MTREELKQHCLKQIAYCEEMTRLGSRFVMLPSTHSKSYEEHKLVLELLEHEPRWIPVSKRLPKVADCYTVTRQIGDVLIVDACYFDGTNTWHNDKWVNHERNYVTNIVAWMEQPQPYRPESEDKE